MKQSDPAAFRPVPAPSGAAVPAAALSMLRQPMPVLKPPPGECIGDIITDGGDRIVDEWGRSLCLAPLP